MTSPACFGCGQLAPEGLAICGQYLCNDCESKLTASKTADLEYQRWIDCCRMFWERMKIDLADVE